MTEEHDLPTAKPETAEESPQMKQARLWLHLDGVAHKIEAAAKELRAESANAGEPGKSVGAQIHAAEHANVNVNRFVFSKDVRDLILATVTAISVLTSLWLWSKLHDAEKDIQTQIWLKDDALTKFEQGPFADIKAHVMALELTCKQEKH